MCNTREENAAELAREAAMPVLPITRAELIDKLVEYRWDDWDHHDTDDVLRYGRIGFEELSNDDLEQIALDYMLEEGGVEVAYTITDADTSKPSAETINAELLDQLREAQSMLGYHMPDTFDDAIHHANWVSKMNAIQAAIAKAEGSLAHVRRTTHPADR